jgi:hypothetical protein
MRAALYSTAHRLQFTGAPAEALDAWDRYLRTSPQGGQALEARYYRALSLVRLGRTEQAKAALLPFARGDYGTFRKQDAARWLERLSASEP